MLLEKARLKLTEDLCYIEDLFKVKKFLIEQDMNMLSLSMFEIEGLWLKFSDSYSAGFLGVSKSNLYDEDGNLIDEANDLICRYMVNGCPLKE